jgi:hypothetical protein
LVFDRELGAMKCGSVLFGFVASSLTTEKMEKKKSKFVKIL